MIVLWPVEHDLAVTTDYGLWHHNYIKLL